MSKKPKHIYLIIADSLRYDSVYQKEGLGIDYIQNHATEFTKVSSSACWTLPATASIFTGLLPHEHGATSQSRMLGKDTVTLGEQLQKQGYKTYQITANVATTEIFGLDKGFNEIHRSWDICDPKTKLVNTLLLILSKPRIRKQISLSKDIVTKALSKDIKAGSVWIESHMEGIFSKVKELTEENDAKDQPCFFFINLMESHFPYHINTAFKVLSKGPVASYKELKHMYSFVNQNFLQTGEQNIPVDILNKIKYRQKLSWKLIRESLDSFVESVHSSKENLVIFGSDHGENFGDQDWLYHFSNVTDACTRVPLFWLDPGQNSAEVISDPKNSNRLYEAILQSAMGNNEKDNGLFKHREESLPISQTYWYNNKNKTLDRLKYNQFSFNIGDARYLFKQGDWYEGKVTNYNLEEEEMKFEKISKSDSDIKDIIGEPEAIEFIFQKLEAYRIFEKTLLPKS